MAYQNNPEAAVTGAQVVVGLFQNANDAHRAITQLKADGFSSRQIGAAFRNSAGGTYAGGTYEDQSVATGTAVGSPHESWWEKVKDAFRTDEERAEHQAAVPVASAGIAAEPVSYGRSQYQSEHEYDYAREDFADSLAAAGIPAPRATYLTSSLGPGGAIVTVREADRQEEAESILAQNGAKVGYEDVAAGDLAVTQQPLVNDPLAGQGVVGTGALTGEPILPGQPLAVEDTTADDETYTDRTLADTPRTTGDRVQLFGEVLRVHKDRISRGEVRIHKDVITESQTIEVPVTREELTLERVPVSGTTPATSASIGRDQEIRVPLSEETVRVEKLPVVREEVIVGKRDVSDIATVSEDVRHEELHVNSDVDAPKLGPAGEELEAERRRLG